MNRPTLFALVLVAGCGDLTVPVESTPRADEPETALSVQALVPAAVEGIVAFRFDLTPVACGDGATIAPTTTTLVPLSERARAPFGPNAELVPDTEHASADLLRVMPAGCYRVEATPLSEDGSPSATCAAARKSNVEVSAGFTSELFVISQCRGRETDHLALLATLNHPPELLILSFGARDGLTCRAPLELCASASDLDLDPLTFELTAPAHCDIHAGAPNMGRWCWRLTCNAAPALLQVRVFDLISAEEEAPERIEDWLIREGHAARSHAERAIEAPASGSLFWPDSDRDGYGDAAGAPRLVCDGEPTHGLAANAADCADQSARIRPGAVEICENAVDDDCDGSVDEDCDGCTTSFACAGPDAPAPPRCGACSEPESAGYCFAVVEGGRACLDDAYCAGLPSCESSSDCALDALCVRGTCCAPEAGVCLRAKLECGLDSRDLSPEAMSVLGTASGAR